MGRAIAGRILLCTGELAAVEGTRQFLEQEGHHVGIQGLAGLDRRDLAAPDLLLVDSGPLVSDTLRFCRQLRATLADHFLPVLLITDAATRLTGLESGADVCLVRPFSPAELLAQVQALLRLKHLHDRSAEKTAEFHRVNKQLEQAYQQIDQELTLARRVQQSMLPQTLPEMPPACFAVQYRPCGQVGGDFYDVVRLDEDHVGFYVADVMGHGVPASLVTMFLKKAVRAKEIFGRDYRLLPPDEVLQLLNRALIAQALAESPFITMVYVLFNRRDGLLTFARAGHPYPLYVPRSGVPELWKVHGTLLGVFDTQFGVQTHQLRKGDKVLFYTDGLDMAGDGDRPPVAGRLLDLAVQHRALPVREFVVRLAAELLAGNALEDDFTLLGLEMRE
jgi:sigma-B regulation protein RsbU (phosphoserine phosphatase)